MGHTEGKYEEIEISEEDNKEIRKKLGLSDNSLLMAITPESALLYYTKENRFIKIDKENNDKFSTKYEMLSNNKHDDRRSQAVDCDCFSAGGRYICVPPGCSA